MVQLSYTSSSNIQGFEGGSGLTRLPQLLGMSGTARSVHDRSQGGVTEGTVCPQRSWRRGGKVNCVWSLTSTSNYGLSNFMDIHCRDNKPGGFHGSWETLHQFNLLILL